MTVLSMDGIRIDGGTQARVAINQQVVDDYAEAMTEGGNLPPVVVFFDGADRWLADGFHRFFAHRKIGAISIDADERQGTQKDARMFGWAANKDHGLRRTNEDKRKAVLGVMADEPEWSDRAIARHVGVTHPFVAAIRSPEVAAKQKATKREHNDREAGQVESVTTPKVESVTTPAGCDADAEGRQPAQAAEPDTQAAADSKLLAGLLLAEQDAHRETLADNTAMGLIFEADDKLATAVAENKKLRAEVSNLRERVNGLLNEKNEAIRLMKSWRRKAEKAEQGQQV